MAYYKNTATSERKRNNIAHEFTLTLESAGAQKIAVIKEVRGINSSLGLKEAKDIVDAAPAVLIEKGTKEAVEKAKAALEAAGATVSVK